MLLHCARIPARLAALPSSIPSIWKGRCHLSAYPLSISQHVFLPHSSQILGRCRLDLRWLHVSRRRLVPTAGVSRTMIPIKRQCHWRSNAKKANSIPYLTAPPFPTHFQYLFRFRNRVYRNRFAIRVKNRIESVTDMQTGRKLFCEPFQPSSNPENGKRKLCSPTKGIDQPTKHWIIIDPTYHTKPIISTKANPIN